MLCHSYFFVAYVTQSLPLWFFTFDVSQFSRRWKRARCFLISYTSIYYSSRLALACQSALCYAVSLTSSYLSISEKREGEEKHIRDLRNVLLTFMRAPTAWITIIIYVPPCANICCLITKRKDKSQGHDFSGTEKKYLDLERIVKRSSRRYFNITIDNESFLRA